MRQLLELWWVPVLFIAVFLLAGILDAVTGFPAPPVDEPEGSQEID